MDSLGYNSDTESSDSDCVVRDSLRCHGRSINADKLRQYLSRIMQSAIDVQQKMETSQTNLGRFDIDEVELTKALEMMTNLVSEIERLKCMLH